MSTTYKKTTLRAKDLTCPSCISKIERELKRLDGVHNAEVHFTTGRIVVEHDPQRAGKDALVAAVGRAGYEAKASAF